MKLKRRPKPGQPAKYVTKDIEEIPYTSEKDLQEAIASYFDNLGKRKVPNKAGLLVHLGISRTTYHDYLKRYPNTIKRTNSMIESAWVDRLVYPGATGAIFYLKNAFKEAYKDKQDHDILVRKEKPILGGLSKQKK